MTARTRIVLGALALVLLSCTPAVVREVTPAHARLVLKFDEKTYYHNVGIAWDGKSYYTINGGNEDAGLISVFDARGRRVRSFSVEADGRSIMYHPDGRKLYIKPYGNELLVYDLKRKKVEAVKEKAFHDEQSSVALDPDGKTVYELSEGTLYIMDFPSCEVRDIVPDLNYEEMPYGSTIAASRNFLFTWDEEGTVQVWDKAGQPVAEFDLPDDRHGMSLTWANGLLWCARDADGKDVGATGTWYGYRLSDE